jgi:hypothetical protein
MLASTASCHAGKHSKLPCCQAQQAVMLSSNASCHAAMQSKLPCCQAT